MHFMSSARTAVKRVRCTWSRTCTARWSRTAKCAATRGRSPCGGTTANDMSTCDEEMVLSKPQSPTPNRQLPTSNYSQLPIPNRIESWNVRWELGIVGSWQLAVGS